MNDNNGGIILAFVASAIASGVMFIVGGSRGYDYGVEDGKNQGIVFCMEKEKECKIKYDYLKLQENQK